MARFLVTGSQGFIGSHLVPDLRHAGHHVTGVDRKPGADVVGDLLDLDLGPLLDGVDYVIHLAGQPGVRESWAQFAAYSRGNIETTQRLLEALRGRPVRKFVLASTSSVYGDAPMPAREDGPALPVSPYGATKLAAESLCDLYGRTAGIPWVALRYFTVYGPRQREDMAFTRWLRAILADQPIPVFGDGQQVRDFTFVADVVKATTLAATGSVHGVPVNVGGGSSVPIMDALQTIQEVVGRRVRIQRLPAAPGDMSVTKAHTDRLQRLLGFKPATPLKTGLQAQLDWLRKGVAEP